MNVAQQSVVQEKRDLDKKIKRLQVKVNNMGKLDASEQARLTAQLHHMTAYSNLLGHRIDAFKG